MSGSPSRVVRLSEAFEFGTLNDPNSFIDYPHLNDEQADAVHRFIYDVSQGNPLPGKNKPSWQDNNGNRLPKTQSYEQAGFWHYHCGPSFSQKPVTSLTFGLNVNIDGITSAEVLFYVKEPDGSITIEGFCANHYPFPQSDDPRKPHPLFP
ncbi:hypothetical protein [Aeromonas dhakensis]|uniref:hypothetical protein n=1 Tax=Aeromonas dhakensis TaxID=196024 RepID=UPI0009B76306|nr:hypothetical protein [Aeromonas dhakensis]